jgi:putative NADPH-quinone reductase
MRITVIDGHPDPNPEHYCHALAQAYLTGAAAGGHETRLYRLGEKSIPLLRSQTEWKDGQPAPDVAAAQEDIRWAEHVVFIYPLWLGDVPAYFKALLEQVLRPGFALADKPGMGGGLLKGRSARIIVTMGMPAFFYNLFFMAHSVKSLKRNVLQFVGFAPVRVSLIGLVEGSAEAREHHLAEVKELGEQGR